MYSESIMTGIVTLLNPNFGKNIGRSLCFYAIAIPALGVEFDDGATGSVSYKVKRGYWGPVTERLTLEIINHELGKQGKAEIKITHTLIGNKKKKEKDKPGVHNGEVWVLGPNTHIFNLPPAGRTSKNIFHGSQKNSTAAYHK
jgi:hypothetical protein